MYCNMEKIKGHIIQNIPFQGLTKVADLMEYEGPILSHFTDEKGNNYLYYWVDYDENVNRWLIWKINDAQLYGYIKGTKSLNKLLLEDNKDFIYSVEIDKDLKQSNIMMIELDDIQESYIPEEDSCYKFVVPKEYDTLLTKYEANAYLTLLRETALFFKLKPITRRYSTTVSAKEAGDFLTKISKSFSGFLEEDFFNSYKSEITDYTKIKKIIAKFKNSLEPRVSHLEFGSFEVGLSVDTISSINNDKYKGWQKSILDKYKENVVDVDYSNEDELNLIAENYSEEARKKIFSPIIDIINNKNYSLESYNQTKTFEKTFKSIEPTKKEIVIPKKIQEKEDEAKKKFYNAVFELGEGDDISKVSKAQLSTGLLFSQPLDEVDFPLNNVSSHGITITFKETIYYKFYIDSNLYYCAEIPDLEISIAEKDKNKARNAIHEKIIELYLDREDVNKELKDKLIELIQKVSSQDDNLNQEGTSQLPPPEIK